MKKKAKKNSKKDDENLDKSLMDLMRDMAWESKEAVRVEFLSVTEGGHTGGLLWACLMVLIGAVIHVGLYVVKI